MEKTINNEIENNLPKYTGRNYGIDLLRMVSMFLICLLHVLGHGGIIQSTAKLSLNYEIFRFLEVVSSCSVACYALISGYVGVKSKFKVSNIIYLWLQVVFYSFFITLGFYIFKPESVNWIMLLKSFLPVTFSAYWYFTAYFIMFLFLPLLNCALKNLSRKTLCFTLITTILVFEVLSILSSIHSALILTVFYLIGGYIRLYNPLKNINSKMCIILIALSVFLAWLSRLCIELITKLIFGEAKWGGTLLTMFSPFILLFSICMLELFSRIKFKNKPWLITFLAPLSFGVYLIHVHNLVRDNMIIGKFAKFATYNPILAVLAVLGTALLIYIVCSLIDYLRLLLFKVLKVKPLLEKAEAKIKEKLFKEKDNA